MTPRLLTVLAGIALLAAACVGPAETQAPTSAPTSAPTAPPTGVGGDLEKPHLRIGILPIVDVATVQTAITNGHFAAQGLTVETEFIAGGAAAIPALVANELDIAYGAWPSFLIANQEGIELRAIADGTAARPGFMEILAMPGSVLESDPAALAGRKVAINTLANLGELAIRSTLQQAGQDPQNVSLVAIPFPEMGAALEQGDIDAIWAVEPVITTTKSALGAVVVADSFVGPLEGFPVAGYQVTKAFADANPNTVAAFQRAMLAAAEETADETTARASIDEYTELPPEVIEVLTLPEYRGVLDPAQLQRVNDYLVEFELLDESLDVESLVLPSP